MQGGAVATTTAVVFGGQSCLAAGGSNIAAFVSGARCSPCDHCHHSHFLDRQPGGRPNGWGVGVVYWVGGCGLALPPLPMHPHPPSPVLRQLAAKEHR